MDSDRPRRRTGRGEWQRRRILEFVPEFARREGYSPSQREIAEGLGLGLATVNYHVAVLERDGSLRRGAGQPRTLAEAGDPASPAQGDAVEVPLIGQIAAGGPVDAVELAEDSFALSRRLVGHGTLFMLRVQRGLDDRGGDHRRGPGGGPAAARGGERRDRRRPAGRDRDR